MAAAINLRVRPQPVATCARSRRHVPVIRAQATAPSQVVNKVIEVTDADFEQQVLQSDKPVLVDFWASWCGPCKLVAPLMNWTQQEYGSTLKVVKVETDKAKGLVEKYKVYGLPTLIVFKDGQEVAGSKREGAINKPMLIEYLKKHEVIA